MELVRDEEHRAPVRGQVADDGKQSVPLLRRQDSRRLVEDQYFRVAVKRLQNLDALAYAYRKPANNGAWINLEMKAFGKRAHFGNRRGPVNETQPRRLARVDDILPDGERVEEPEGLVDHSHALGDRVES